MDETPERSKDRSAARAPKGIGEALDALLHETRDQEHVRIGHVLDTFGTQAFGPLILIPALLLTLPTGALPGVPLALGAFIALICIEIVLGLDRPTIPRLFSRMKIARKSVVSAREKSAGVVKVVDRMIRPRLTFLVRHPFLEIIAVACIVLCVLLVPVEIIPFATALPGSVLILLGLAITARDGLVAALGLGGAGAAGWGSWLLLT